MQWENLTTPQFAAAVERAEGVCLLPLGVIEKHGLADPGVATEREGAAPAEASLA